MCYPKKPLLIVTTSSWFELAFRSHLWLRLVIPHSFFSKQRIPDLLSTETSHESHLCLQLTFPTFELSGEPVSNPSDSKPSQCSWILVYSLLQRKLHPANLLVNTWKPVALPPTQMKHQNRNEHQPPAHFFCAKFIYNTLASMQQQGRCVHFSTH